MKIMNTGGTFNKRYNPVSGELEVPFDNLAVEEIVKSFSYEVDIAGMLYKDSLEMDQTDRDQLTAILSADDENIFVVIHGTDTMHLTAEQLAEYLPNRVIVLVGSMVPFSLDKCEASLNLGMALGFAATQPSNGVYICMSGIIAPHDKILKNREEGRFEIV
ncbi:MAG: asparaginase domain-containing protein [Helicobacteraceae bacterium]|jgi:L-asparaginase|nr:asparaginase domain-containing protein [Helicobacteraceae bacterium]